MELHPLNSKEVHPLSMDDDEEQGVFIGGAKRAGAREEILLAANDVAMDDDDEEEVSNRYHRVDSIDEMGSERVGLVPGQHQRTGTKPIVPGNNLDAFFKEMYEYYHKKGFGSIVSTAITNLTSILFTICITVFLLTMFDWQKLSECRDDDKRCEPLSGYIEHPMANSTLFSRFVLGGSFIAFLGWLWVLRGFFSTVAAAWKYRSIYRSNGITTRDLQTMSWSRVVTKLRDYQKQVFYVKNDMQVNAFTIAMRIMRKENYKIAFFSMNILPLGSPDWATTFAWVPYTKKFKERRIKRARPSKFQETEIWWMGTALEANLDFAVFNNIVNEETFALTKGLTPWTIRVHLRVLAVLNLFFLPMIFSGMFLFFFFRYFEEFHSRRNYLGPRWWTPHAMWILREFNELPHVFQRRLNGSLRLGEKYLRMFPSPVPIVLARGAAFILGGLVAILLVFALVDDAVLLHVSLWDRNLVWYAAVLSSALAGARALIPPPEEESPGNPNVQMRRVAAFTHLLPDFWRGKANTYDVKEAFEGLFPFRITLLVRELLCVVFTPYILWFVLPEYADDIVRFIKDYTSTHPGVGDVCTFSLMNLEKDGDPKWNKLLKAIPFTAPLTSSQIGGPGAASVQFDEDLQSSGDERRARYKMDPLVESKLEKSWITFKIQYSADNCGIRDAIGEDLLRRVKDFQASRKSSNQEQTSQAAMLMSSSLSAFDAYQLLPPPLETVEEEYHGGAGEEIFWYMEQYKDEELKKRSV